MPRVSSVLAALLMVAQSDLEPMMIPISGVFGADGMGPYSSKRPSARATAFRSAQVRGHKGAAGRPRGEAVEAEGCRTHGRRGAGDQRRHHLAHRRRQLETVAR